MYRELSNQAIDTCPDCGTAIIEPPCVCTADDHYEDRYCQLCQDADPSDPHPHGRGTGRAYCSVADVWHCEECGHSNWQPEPDAMNCPRCDGKGLANTEAIRAYDGYLARAYR